MDYQDRINTLIELGIYLSKNEAKIETLAEAAFSANPWFTVENIKKSISAIQSEFLSEAKIETWASNYNLEEEIPKRVGLVLAGNIPLVGWHDVMCTYVAGHRSMIKYSSKDDLLIPALIEMLVSISPASAQYFEKVELLKEIDAVIATGGETASTHFNYYFAKYPHIIRKNRSSCAVLTGEETEEELVALTDDIFDYFGLGCRSVSKIYMPRGYDKGPLFEASMKHAHVINHNKYKNNYDYTNALYLLAQFPFLTNNFLILKEDKTLSSRISCVHTEEYDNIEDVEADLTALRERLQCVATGYHFDKIDVTPFGFCQRPALADYADGIDTMTFLTQLS